MSRCDRRRVSEQSSQFLQKELAPTRDGRVRQEFRASQMHHEPRSRQLLTHPRVRQCDHHQQLLLLAPTQENCAAVLLSRDYSEVPYTFNATSTASNGGSDFT